MADSTDAPTPAAEAARPERDRPWVMRTYAGHSSAAASNELYRRNLAKGQTGLSVAFDLPTQTGYDPDHVLSRGEVGKVGVPISHIGDMRRLFDQIPLGEMNTSMTINAVAMYMLALYQVAAEEQAEAAGQDPAEVRARLAGTTQNDIIKEYLSRGTYVFPPGPSMRLITDMVTYTVGEIPKWNPINICSYHLQEAGATPVQEIAYSMSTALAVLVYRVGLPLWTSWRHDLRVAGVDRLAPDVVTVTVTGRDLHRLPVSAGQFFQWRFAGRGQTRAHPYSLSHAPDGRTLRITAQEVGDGTDALASLRPGTRALVEGPYGRMHDGVRTKPKVLLMGSGIGVTPLRAMFESIPAAPGDVTLIYRAGSDAHLLWADELQAIAR